MVRARGEGTKELGAMKGGTLLQRSKRGRGEARELRFWAFQGSSDLTVRQTAGK